MTIHFELAPMVTATLRSPESHLTQTHTQGIGRALCRQNTNLYNARGFSTASAFQQDSERNPFFPLGKECSSHITSFSTPPGSTCISCRTQSNQNSEVPKKESEFKNKTTQSHAFSTFLSSSLLWYTNNGRQHRFLMGKDLFV